MAAPARSPARRAGQPTRRRRRSPPRFSPARPPDRRWRARRSRRAPSRPLPSRLLPSPSRRSGRRHTGKLMLNMLGSTAEFAKSVACFSARASAAALVVHDVHQQSSEGSQDEGISARDEVVVSLDHVCEPPGRCCFAQPHLHDMGCISPPGRPSAQRSHETQSAYRMGCKPTSETLSRDGPEPNETWSGPSAPRRRGTGAGRKCGPQDYVSTF